MAPSITIDRNKLQPGQVFQHQERGRVTVEDEPDLKHDNVRVRDEDGNIFTADFHWLNEIR